MMNGYTKCGTSIHTMECWSASKRNKVQKKHAKKWINLENTLSESIQTQKPTDCMILSV